MGQCFHEVYPSIVLAVVGHSRMFNGANTRTRTYHLRNDGDMRAQNIEVDRVRRETVEVHFACCEDAS